MLADMSQEKLFPLPLKLKVYYSILIFLVFPFDKKLKFKHQYF